MGRGRRGPDKPRMLGGDVGRTGKPPYPPPPQILDPARPRFFLGLCHSLFSFPQMRGKARASLADWGEMGEVTANRPGHSGGILEHTGTVPWALPDSPHDARPPAHSQPAEGPWGMTSKLCKPAFPRLKHGGGREQARLGHLPGGIKSAECPAAARIINSPWR